jgi:hypothetical protein
MPLILDNEQCLLWIKDPSISPFVNNYVARKYKKDILNDDSLKNPKSFLNRIRRKCFYNSALRRKIVDQIKEYQSNGELRLYTLNDKLIDDFIDIDYTITPPFTIEECKKWAKWGSWQDDHLVNPRTNERIIFGSNVYIELLYTTLQLGLKPPTYRFKNLYIPKKNSNSKELNDENSKDILKIIKNIQFRLEFMKDNDNYFLNHNIESFDKKLKIEPVALHRSKSSITKQNNTFNVSTSSGEKGLNTGERKLLRDKALENIEEKKLVAEYQYKKGFIKKSKTNKPIFTVFRNFLIDLQNEVTNGNQLINKILEGASEGIKSRLTQPVYSSFMNKGKSEPSYVKYIIESNNLDTAEGIISNFINNMITQLIDPLFVVPRDMAIGCFTFINKTTHFRNTELISYITKELFNFIDKYSLVIDINTRKYFKNLVDDVIPPKYVAKREIDRRIITTRYFTSSSDYQNYYYKMLLYISSSDVSDDKIRLSKGKGVLIGKELIKAIYDLKDPYLDIVLIDDNPLNGFTYEECRDWVILPIVNPRTFKPILIDSPIYNRLLCMSYQYDINLIPRMMTSLSYKILFALTEIILNILNEERGQPQTRDELEQSIISTEVHYRKEKEKNEFAPNIIGLKWKNAGIKQPKGGIEIINKKLIDAFIKFKGPNGELPFYVLFNEDDFVKLNITDIAKNSYINIATYYIPVIYKRGSKSTKNIVLKWKKAGIKDEDIIKKGVPIINKNLTKAFLKLKDSKGELPLNVLFEKEDFIKFDIRDIAKYSYIKLPNYYVPVANKTVSELLNKEKKSKSNNVIVKRDDKYNIYKYYTVAECMRWAQQPNRDPKNPEILLITDGEEYNAIFEQALLYDYNIQPINITPKGIKFRKAVLKISEKYLTIAKHLKLPVNANNAEINSRVCNAIKEIYDDEGNEEGKKYKKFKDKMIEKCTQYNKEPGVCIEELKVSIDAYFQPESNHEEKYNLIYYQESALASLLIYYDYLKGKIYKEEVRDIFIHDFNKFYVYTYEIDDDLNEHKKDAIDAGGPKREFFSKLLEELFCDEEHLTRPFISPKNIIGNLYYINPNFVPDEKFIKVIKAYKKNYKYDIGFNTERDYEYIYFVIGKLLCLTVYNELIGLPQLLSSYILAGFINQPKDLDYYDILYFYLKDFESTIPYINMISNKGINDIEYADLSFNNLYVVSKALGGSQNSSGVKITKENCIKFILQQSKHVVTKNFLVKEDVNSSKSMKKRYDSLFAGFSNEIRKFLYRKKVTIEQLSLLITNEQLTDAILEEFASKIRVKIEVSYLSESDPDYDPNNKLSDQEKTEKENEIKLYMSNIITKNRDGVTYKEHLNFIKNLLRFWTGLTYYNKNSNYTIFYKYGERIDINKLPVASTCFYNLYVFGFPNEYNAEKREQFLYDKFKLAVGEQEMELQ